MELDRNCNAPAALDCSAEKNPENENFSVNILKKNIRKCWVKSILKNKRK